MKTATVLQLVHAGFARFGDRPAMLCRDEGEQWVTIGYDELSDRVGRLARGLLALGIERGQRVAIIADTCPEWSFADLAIAAAGAVSVPLHPQSSRRECEYVLAHSGARMAIVQGPEQLAMAQATARRGGAALELFLALTDDPPMDLPSLRDVCAMGDRYGGIATEPGADDRFTIVYTSGSTGPPKGCVHTHGSYAAAIEQTARRQRLAHGDLSYLYLPLAHVFGREVQYLTLAGGGCVAYFGGDRGRVLEELQALKPTFFASVPRLYERAYGEAHRLLDEHGALPSAAELELALEARLGGDPLCARLELGPFQTVRDLFGGRLRAAWSGAAPIERDVLRFLFACGVPVYEGYGMTETAVAVTLGAGSQVKLGTCGRPLPEVRLRLTGEGEVQVKGPMLFEGYLDDDAATRGAKQGGWLRTGDLGALDADGFLTVTGRSKEMIITANGKNVAPAMWEIRACACPEVEQAVMIGDRRPYLTALLVATVLPGVDSGPAAEPRRLVEAVRTANEGLPAWAQVKRFAVLEHPLSHAAGELTPGGKLRRAAITERYRDVIEDLYRMPWANAPRQDRRVKCLHST